LLDVQILEIRRSGKKYSVITRNTKSGSEHELSSEAVLVAAGRRSNADLLNLIKTGVEVDKRGFIRVDDYLETTRKNIYAAGDIIGRYMFTHVANREAALVWHNATHGPPEAMVYDTIPHAVFTYPQIASVGLTEVEARKQHRILVGISKYSEVAKGIAMKEEDGFAKAIVDGDTERILGFHIIGPEASTLIQEVTNAMASGKDIESIHAGIHIHPAMPELIMSAFYNLRGYQPVDIRPQTVRVAAPPG